MYIHASTVAPVSICLLDMKHKILVAICPVMTNALRLLKEVIESKTLKTPGKKGQYRFALIDDHSMTDKVSELICDGFIGQIESEKAEASLNARHEINTILSTFYQKTVNSKRFQHWVRLAYGEHVKCVNAAVRLLPKGISPVEAWKTKHSKELLQFSESRIKAGVPVDLSKLPSPYQMYPWGKAGFMEFDRSMPAKKQKHTSTSSRGLVLNFCLLGKILMTRRNNDDPRPANKTETAAVLVDYAESLRDAGCNISWCMANNDMLSENSIMKKVSRHLASDISRNELEGWAFVFDFEEVISRFTNENDRT